ncbi:MAG: HNH endonuclease [Deltaproteobacteria bacterium]|nr:HNH endonuclease [Deltaproteobacteria bacterium]
MREIERLIAELAPKPDVASSIRALPTKKPESQLLTKVAGENPSPPQSTTPVPVAPKSMSRPVPLAPKRYKLQVTIGEDTRAKLEELQALLSHQIPDGDPAKILDRALDVLLAETKKKKAALTDRPRASQKESGSRTRRIPSRVRREVFERDEGRCAFVDAEGRRCDATWHVEFHHRNPYGRGGTHDVENIELRCRGHNQYEAELEFGAGFMAGRRAS